VGKKELLRWVNEFFNLDYTKIEQAASGALHCQILDAIYPGKVPMHKVNFDAKYDYEFVKNFKVMQEVFDKEGIIKVCPVDQLVRAKHQDNLEFLQWMKNYFELKYTGQEYDAVKRREQAIKQFKSANKVGGSNVVAIKKASAPMVAKKPAKVLPSEQPKSSVTSMPVTKPGVDKPKPSGQKVAQKPSQNALKSMSSNKLVSVKPVGNENEHPYHADSQVAELQAELARLKEQLGEIPRLREEKAGAEKERNFYFEKLREIEILCQEKEETDSATKAAVLKVLYTTDDNNEFVTPSDDISVHADLPDDEALDFGDQDGVDDLLAGDVTLADGSAVQF